MAMQNALYQYIELYNANRPVVEARSSEPLNRLRTAALEALETAGRLPAKGDEGFEKTSINDMFAPDFGVNISGVNIPADIASSFRCGVPNLSTLMGVVVNDRFTPHLHAPEKPSGRGHMCSLSEAAGKHPGIVGKWYGSVANLDSPGTALNTLLAQEGVFIHAGPRHQTWKSPCSLSAY